MNAFAIVYFTIGLCFAAFHVALVQLHYPAGRQNLLKALVVWCLIWPMVLISLAFFLGLDKGLRSSERKR